MMTWRRLLLPAGVDAAAGPLLVARALRAFADGYMAILLPAYLLALGLGTLEVGVVATATMFGSALATVAVGAALGALAAAIPAWLVASGVSDVAALRAMFVLYGAVGLLVWQLYRRQP